MINIRRLFQSTNVFIVCSLLLTAAFLFHCKLLYQAYQKRLRLNEYNALMNEMTQDMHVIENIVNKTEHLMHTLKKTMDIKDKEAVRMKQK